MSLESPQQRWAHQPGRGCRIWSALGPRGAGQATVESATGRGCRAGTCRPTARGPRSAAGRTKAPTLAAHPRERDPDTPAVPPAAPIARTLLGANAGNGGSPHSGPRAALVKFSLLCNHKSCIHWGGVGSGEVFFNRIIARPGVTTFFFFKTARNFFCTSRFSLALRLGEQRGKMLGHPIPGLNPARLLASSTAPEPKTDSLDCGLHLA